MVGGYSLIQRMNRTEGKVDQTYQQVNSVEEVDGKPTLAQEVRSMHAELQEIREQLR